MYIPAAVWKVLQRNPAVPLQSLLTSAKHCHSAHDAQNYSHLVNFMGRRLDELIFVLEVAIMKGLIAVVVVAGWVVTEMCW